MIQEHHARRLHWDLRLERDGVAVSWALPRGIPDDPDENHLAVHTEDHPIEYLEFEGEIPKGEYGAGTMRIWDAGTYEAEKFEHKKVVLRFDGERVKGRYALFATRGDDWMIHRMDPPDPGREPMPQRIEPMKATLAKLPGDDEGWGYEIKWDGVRAIAYCEPGLLRLESRSLREITSQYPEIRPIVRELGGRSAMLDGELVAYDDARPAELPGAAGPDPSCLRVGDPSPGARDTGHLRRLRPPLPGSPRALRRPLRGAARASSRRSGSRARAGRPRRTTPGTARPCSRRARRRASRESSRSGSRAPTGRGSERASG